MGYWYTVEHNFMAYTAFETFEGLSNWMAERGLNFSQELPPAKTYQMQSLIGEFYDHMHRHEETFLPLEGHKTKVMSNGSYTLAVVTVDDNGCRVVNYLNPNCNRINYDWQEIPKNFR
jgi:hypothetical protein